jgi:YD repeat-containing protein
VSPSQRGGKPKASRNRNRGAPGGRRPDPPPEPPKHPRLAVTGKAAKDTAPYVVSVLALVVSILTYVNQRATNNAAIQADKSAIQADNTSAAAAVRKDAEQVTYWLQGSTPQMMIQNSSDGPIRDITIFLPESESEHGKASALIHLPPGFQGAQVGIELTGKGSYLRYTLPDISPCRIETTTAFTMLFKSPKVGAAALNGTILEFTDPDGKSWERYDGDGRLIELTRYKAPTGFSYGNSPAFTPASGCS